MNFHNFIPSFTFLYAKLELTSNQRLSEEFVVEWNCFDEHDWICSWKPIFSTRRCMWCVPFRTFTLSFQVVFKESCPVTRDHMHYPESLNLLQRIAEDLRKQIFLSFWSSLPSGSFGTSLAWIFRIAKMSFIMTCPVIIIYQCKLDLLPVAHWNATPRPVWVQYFTYTRHVVVGSWRQRPSSVKHVLPTLSSIFESFVPFENCCL